MFDDTRVIGLILVLIFDGLDVLIVKAFELNDGWLYWPGGIVTGLYILAALFVSIMPIGIL